MIIYVAIPSRLLSNKRSFELQVHNIITSTTVTMNTKRAIVIPEIKETTCKCFIILNALYTAIIACTNNVYTCY